MTVATIMTFSYLERFGPNGSGYYGDDVEDHGKVKNSTYNNVVLVFEIATYMLGIFFWGPRFAYRGPKSAWIFVHYVLALLTVSPAIKLQTH